MSKFGTIVAGCALSLLMAGGAQACHSTDYSSPTELPDSGDGSFAIGFEDDAYVGNLRHGQIIDNEYSLAGGYNGLPGLSGDVGVTVTTHNYNQSFGYGVIFDTTVDSPDRDRCNPRDRDLWAGFDGNSYDTNPNHGYNPGNVLIIQENNYYCGDGVCNYPDDEGGRAAGYFEFEFSELVDITSIDFFDIENAENNQNAEIYFWTDSAGTTGGEDTTGGGQYAIDNPDTDEDHWQMVSTGDNGWNRMTFNVEGVKKLRIEMGGSGAIDNITGHRHVDNTPGQVPEPGTLALFGFGLGLLLVLRRRALI
ncbi:hypothetical protein JCM17960_31430 [Magnetospira thiophila]